MFHVPESLQTKAQSEIARNGSHRAETIRLQHVRKELRDAQSTEDAYFHSHWGETTSVRRL